MGSSNQTCAVSHMPIVAGQRAAGFILAKSYTARGVSVDGYTGQGKVWQTVSLPFKGVYNDYGFLDDIERQQADVSLRASCDVKFEAIVAAAAGGKEFELAMRDPYGTTKLMAMFVHESLFDRLSSSTENNVGRAVGLEDEVARIDEFLDVQRQATAARQVGRKFPEPGIFDRFDEATEDWAAVTGRNWTEAPYIGDFFAMGGAEGVHPALKRAVVKLVEHNVGAANLADNRLLLSECLRTAVFDQNMSKLRRLWTPQCGLGSSDTDYGLQSEVASWVSERCKTLSRDEDFDDGADLEGEDVPSVSPRGF